MRTALLCTACLLTGFTTVAVAVPPGWTWGAGNCGFPNTMTEIAAGDAA